MKTNEIKAALNAALNADAALWVRAEGFEGLWKVEEVKSGWVHAEHESGTGTKAFRAAKIEVVEVELDSDDETEEGDEEASAGRLMARTLDRYRAMGRYLPSRGPRGTKSESNHDAVANWLEGREPAEVMTLAEQLLGLDRGFLMEKYGHLNRGQQRMNSGNRIRAALKRGELVIDEEGQIRVAQA